MCHALWPEASVAEHARDLVRLWSGTPLAGLPTVLFVAQKPDGILVGFVEVGLRSHADGCDTSRPVGFIEGWYVTPAYRRKKVGARLLAAAEGWARNEGCSEMASDTWLDNLDSQRAHEAAGYSIVDRCVHYRKSLVERNGPVTRRPTESIICPITPQSCARNSTLTRGSS